MITVLEVDDQGIKRKKCSKCGTLKPAEDFYVDSRLRSGLSSACTDCQAVKRAKQRNTGYIRFYHIGRRYGIKRGDYERMYNEQEGLCAICYSTVQHSFARVKDQLHVDHCHTTGKVRGLLCPGCNLLLGRIETYGGLTYLEMVGNYIKKNQSRN